MMTSDGVMSERPRERELGVLREEFTEEVLGKIDRALLEPMSDEELALWYDLPMRPEPEIPMTNE